MSKKYNKNYDRQHNSAMGDAVSGALRNNNLVVRKTNGKTGVWKAADSWKGDGEDHINIDFYAETNLGKMLDFSYRLNFKHPIFLNFATISGFWAYIRSEERSDRLRFAVGRELQSLTKQLTQRKIPHLKAIVMDAAYQRIRCSTQLNQQMYENELPFDMYRAGETGVRIRPAHHDWVVNGYMEIQKAIQEGREPNFSFLCDDPNNPPTDIYETIRPVIPESTKRRLQTREESKKPTTSKPVHESKTPKTSKRDRDIFIFKPDQKYTILVPSINESTDILFLKQFRRTVKINDIAVQTGPVVADVSLPLLQISDHQELFRAGLITSDDVIRAAPIIERTFVDGFETNNLIKLDTFVVGVLGEIEVYSIPLWLKLMDRNIDREGDKQVVMENSEGGDTIKLKRDVLLYKPIDSLLTETGVKPPFVVDAEDLVRNQMDSDKYKYIVLGVSFNLIMLMNEQPGLFLSGNVKCFGISTGSHDDDNKERVMFDEEELNANPVYDIKGYTFTLFRGQIIPEPTQQLSADDHSYALNVDKQTEGVSDKSTEGVLVDSNTFVEGSADNVFVDVVDGTTGATLVDSSLLHEDEVDTNFQEDSGTTTMSTEVSVVNESELIEG